MSTDTKFETFWTTLNQCPYELPVEIKPYLQKAIQSAGFSENLTISTSGVALAAATGKVKKLSGYNLYMREKMAELKEQNVPSGERMTKVSVMWKVLTDEEKGTWKVKAEGLTPSATAPATTVTQTVITQPTAISAPAGPKKLSGYQLYVRETMAVVKANPAIAAKERMGEIGKMWKALSDEQKAAYKVKAETL